MWPPKSASSLLMGTTKFQLRESTSTRLQEKSFRRSTRHSEDGGVGQKVDASRKIVRRFFAPSCNGSSSPINRALVTRRVSPYQNRRSAPAKKSAADFGEPNNTTYIRRYGFSSSLLVVRPARMEVLRFFFFGPTGGATIGRGMLRDPLTVRCRQLKCVRRFRHM